MLTWLLARRTGVIPLSTAHGWTGHSARERRLYYPLDKRLLARFPQVIAVSCPFCMTMLSDGIKAKDLEDRVETLDVVEIVDRVAR